MHRTTQLLDQIHVELQHNFGKLDDKKLVISRQNQLVKTATKSPPSSKLVLPGLNFWYFEGKGTIIRRAAMSATNLEAWCEMRQCHQHLGGVYTRECAWSIIFRIFGNDEEAVASHWDTSTRSSSSNRDSSLDDCDVGGKTRVVLHDFEFHVGILRGIRTL